MTIVPVSGSDIMVIGITRAFFMQAATAAPRVEAPGERSSAVEALYFARQMRVYTSAELEPYKIERVTLDPAAKTDSEIYRSTNTGWLNTRVLAEGVQEFVPFVRIMDGGRLERWIPLDGHVQKRFI